MRRTLLRSFALGTALTLSAFSTALAGPPWIAIEYPANPFDRASRDAFLTVRTYHHGEIMAKTVTGTAEGVVNGKRESMKLDIRPGSRPGMYVVFWQRPAAGRWVLVINSGIERTQLFRKLRDKVNELDAAHTNLKDVQSRLLRAFL